MRNTQRAIGARASSNVVRKWGMTRRRRDSSPLQLSGSAGQSLGAFLVQGIAIDVTGDANDYVGKGLSGGLIMLKPPPERSRSASQRHHRQHLLYGATNGKLFAAGLAGERFAVRNSGAIDGG